MLAVTIVAHEPGYYTSLANTVHRWLDAESVASCVVKPDGMAAALANERLAFLIGFENPKADEIVALRTFRAKGGKLVVFNSSSKELGALMGVEPVGFATASTPGIWSRMDFTAPAPSGTPARIRQTSGVLHRARPVAGRGRVLATWADRTGKSTDEPAWIATDAGFWMTHVLLTDGDEDLKAQFVAAIVGSVSPGLWNFAAHQARVEKQRKAWRELALRQVPRKGEVHAVWDHSGCGLYPGDWPRTMRALKEAHVTDLFVNIAGAGFAHYASGVLPRSKTFEQEGDQLAKCLAAAKGTGVRVHAWILCFSATRSSSSQLALFGQRGWRLKSAAGKLTDYLDPSNPTVRAYVLAAIAEIQSKYAVSGIHLDFVRWGESAVKPENAAEAVTQFVADVRKCVKRPRWLTAAVYGRHPKCVGTVGQDWEKWLDLNLVDLVVPMNYTNDRADFEEIVAHQARKSAYARRIIGGIGVSANESHLDAAGVIDQINVSRRYGFVGNALFDLDIMLVKDILPYLKTQIWK